MEYFVSIIWGSLDIVFFSLFWSAFFTSKKKPHAFICSLIAACAISVAISFFEIPQPFRTILSFAFLFCIAKALYKKPWYQVLLIVTVGYILGAFFDVITSYGLCAILGISLTQLLDKKLMYICICTLGKLVAIFCAWLLSRCRRASFRPAIHRKWILLSLLFPSVSLLVMTAMYSLFSEAADLSLGSFILSGVIAISNIGILYLITIMEKREQESQQISLLHKQMDIQTDSILALEKSYRSQRKLTHDFRNQLQTIYGLLLDNEIDSAKEYIAQLQALQTNRILISNSRHAVLDAVLNMKYQYAQDHNIDFHIKLTDLSTISISTNTLVVLLSNLLDNAIEACCRIPSNRSINCEIILENNLYLSVSNTSPPVKIENNHIPTSKEPKEEHGFGLLQIQYLLDQLGSEYCFTYEAGWFTFAAEIPQ